MEGVGPEFFQEKLVVRGEQEDQRVVRQNLTFVKYLKIEIQKILK